MKSQPLSKRLKKQLPLQFMVLPAIALMIVFCYVPLYGLLIAFKNYGPMDTFNSAPWVGLENFKIAFSDINFWHAVVNTLGISVISLLVGFPLPIILAIMISEVKDGFYKKTVQTISYLPHFFSWVILGGMLITWLSCSGLTNQFLQLIGVVGKNPPNYIINPNNYWVIAALSSVWKDAGWNTILYLATITSIDTTYYEASRIDGATKLQNIWYITLPQMKYIIALTFVLACGSLLNSNLDQTMVLQNPLNTSNSEVINSYVYHVGLGQGNFSYATAVGFAISIVSFFIVMITQSFTKRLNGRSIF